MPGFDASADGQNGSDIWNTADQFNFASTNYTGDGTMIALVLGWQNSDPSSGWSKAGLMFRNPITCATEDLGGIEINMCP